MFTFSDLEGCVLAGSLPAAAPPGGGFMTHTALGTTLVSTGAAGDNSLTIGGHPAWNRAREPTVLKVHFKPKMAGRYHSRFRFQVTCGDSVDLDLRGVGSYDEQYVVHKHGHSK